MPRKVTSKGQVTIPKSVRDYLGLHAGTAITFDRLPSGEVVLRAVGSETERRPSAFARLRGRATIHMSTEEILALTRGG
jgi:AbrB family looped-hinge helix DNA binding protein